LRYGRQRVLYHFIAAILRYLEEKSYVTTSPPKSPIKNQLRSLSMITICLS